MNTKVGGLIPGFDVNRDVLSPIGSALTNNPIAQALGDAAKSDFGQFLLQAAATSLTGGLATVVGPQLASVAFALPGMAKGDDFAKAYGSGLIDRVAKTAKILSAGQFDMNGVSDKLGETFEQIKPTIDSIKNVLPMDQINSFLSSSGSASGISDPTKMLQQIPGLQNLSIANLTKQLGNKATEAATMWAKSNLTHILPPDNLIIDAITGKIWVPEASAASLALGIDVAPAPNTNLTVPQYLAKITYSGSNYAPTTDNIDAMNGILRDMKTDPNKGIVYVPEAVADWLSNHGIARERLLTPKSLVSKIQLDADQKLTLKTTTIDALNQVLTFLKINPNYSVYVPDAAIVWLVAHGIKPSRLVRIPPPIAYSLSQMTFNADGSIPAATANSDRLNDILTDLKRDKTSIAYVPPSVVTWLANHGIEKTRLLSLPDLTASLVLNPDGSLPATTNSSVILNGILGYLKTNKNTMYAPPSPSVATWLINHGISYSRLMATSSLAPQAPIASSPLPAKTITQNMSSTPAATSVLPAVTSSNPSQIPTGSGTTKTLIAVAGGGAVLVAGYALWRLLKRK